ncbi:hypothetical protein EMCRGX_G021134 [Ephydatia muelleri]
MPDESLIAVRKQELQHVLATASDVFTSHCLIASRRSNDSYCVQRLRLVFVLRRNDYGKCGYRIVIRRQFADSCCRTFECSVNIPADINDCGLSDSRCVLFRRDESDDSRYHAGVFVTGSDTSVDISTVVFFDGPKDIFLAG